MSVRVVGEERRLTGLGEKHVRPRCEGNDALQILDGRSPAVPGRKEGREEGVERIAIAWEASVLREGSQDGVAKSEIKCEGMALTGVDDGELFVAQLGKFP